LRWEQQTSPRADDGRGVISGGKASSNILTIRDRAGGRWGRGRAEQRLAPDCLQPSLLRRCGFRQQVKAGVRPQTSASECSMTTTYLADLRSPSGGVYE